MPPKSAKKSKASTPEPPSKPVKQTPTKATPTTSTPTKPTPTKKPKEPLVYRSLEGDGGAPILIDVIHEGTSVHSKPSKGGKYAHVLKLEAPNSFSLVNTVVFTEGPYEGQQAIFVRPAKALLFLKLPKEARNRIYDYYFAPTGSADQSITLDGKRTNKDIYAKTYAEGHKDRVGLLAVNKEIHQEAISVFYAHKIKLESTTALLDFLSQVPTTVRPLLHDIEIKTYIRTTSRTALQFLAEARNLQRLHIDAGVSAEDDPAKAAKNFYNDASKFLESMGNAKGDRHAGVDMLAFGKLAFTQKDDKSKPWKEEQVEKFKDCLRAKLK